MLPPAGSVHGTSPISIRGTGKVRRRSLGGFPHVTLDAARGRATDILRAARAGLDLLGDESAAREAESKRITVKQLISEYARRQLHGRLRTASEIERRLKRALAPLIHKPAADIRRREIRELLDAAADRGLSREAEKRRQVVGGMYRWAMAQDYVDSDPTAGLSAYDPGTPRERVLSAEEIHALWHWLATSDIPPAMADLLRFQLATGARCGEIGGIMADEIDTEAWTWTLPAARSKNKRMRITPLVGFAQEIVSTRLASAGNKPLFPCESGKPLMAHHLGNALDHRRERLPVARFTTHDIRRTVATMLDGMGISLDVIATTLGQEAGGRNVRTLVRHYIRGDQIERKTNVLTSWDENLRKIVTGTAASSRIARLKVAGQH